MIANSERSGVRHGHGRFRYVLNILGTAALGVMAIVTLGLMLVPRTTWHQSPSFATYYGFDPYLIYADANGGSASGVIHVTRDRMLLMAVPGSRPSVDLLSSDLDFTVSADLLLLQNDTTAEPLTIRIWSPREAVAYSLDFGPAPADEIRASQERDGKVTALGVLGTYSPGVRYHLDVGLNRLDGRLTVLLSSSEKPPAPLALDLVGGPSEPGYTEVRSDFIPVVAGRQFSYGGTLLVVRGADSYKLILEWFDHNKTKIGSAGDWRPVNELNGWTGRTFSAVAPPRAAYARMNLGAGNGGTQLLMTSLFIRDLTSPNLNLVANGDFRSGTTGWVVIGAATSNQKPKIDSLTSTSIQQSVEARTLPGLFYKLPVALTIRSASDTSLTSIALENYRLRIPAQPWPVDRVQDYRAIVAAYVLAIGGAVFWGGWLVARFGRGLSRRTLDMIEVARSRISRDSVLVVAALGVMAAAYLIANLFLFGLGSGTFDMAGERIWSYVGAYYGPAELYFLPSTVTPAQVWGGVPFAGVTFPYGPVMVWFFTGIGWIYRVVLAGPAAPSSPDFALVFLIKTANVVFGLLDGLLVYVIVRRTGASERMSLVASALVLLNPAVWFLMSVWGETQTISLFLLLVAIWAAQRDRTAIAWFFIVAAALARPQLGVPAFIMALFLLRWFGLRTNLRALAWAIVAIGIVMAPLVVQLGPALPADYVLNIVHGQASADPHVSQFNYVSFDGYNVWPLVTGFASGQLGKARLYFPDSSRLVDTLTYKNVANGAFALAFFLLGLCALLRGKGARADGRFIVVLGTATLALLLLETGVSAQHFVIALVFVVMSINLIRPLLYFPLVIALSLTTLVSMYGSLGFALSYPGASALAPALYGGTNALTRFAMGLFVSDPFITIGIVANVVVLLCMAVASVLKRRARGSGDQREAALA